MPFADRASMERILDYIEEYKATDERAADEAAAGLPLGFKSVGDDEFVLWFEAMAAKHQPVLVTEEDDNGHPITVVVNPWIAALPYTENGDALLRRYERLVGGA